MLVSDAETGERMPTEDHSTSENVADDDYSSFTPKRRWPLVLGGVLIGAVGALLAQQLLAGSDNEVVATAEAVELALVEVTSTDLTEEVEWSGELAYGSEVSFTGGGGVITAVTPVGTIVVQGDILVEEDRLARMVFYGTIPPYRTMAVGDEGPDVLQLEENLVALGYDVAEQLNVDGVFTDYTETLVMRWQLALGAEESGVVTPEAVAVLAGPSIIRTAPVVGSQASGPIVTVAASEDLRITVPVEVADADEWSVGQSAEVELVDGSQLSASVEDVGTIITTDNNGSTIDVVLRLVGDAGDVPEGPVTVLVAGEVVADALVVPTRALVALQEGGFAVQKATGGGDMQLIGVEIGTFDDGVVQITAGDLLPGDQVVVPR